jgi:hypothetical protein
MAGAISPLQCTADTMTLGNMRANGVRTLAAQSRGNAVDTSVLMLSRIGKKESKRVAKR